ncbi:MAG: hypothetical protein GW903_04140 [Alphaproteobacteria bacterium]|nr:hypothetical protein [Alphaproteobacteria bacterium]NCQ88158.1 hypothetical protein [Alphaproteobacteria bacterium]NCT05335.1 hypothetical protein [Alphaproteobacteria bacterium]
MKSLLTLAFAVLAFMPKAHAMDDMDTKKMMDEKPAMTAEAPKVKAVVFYSDSCSACKVLGPKMEQAMQAINMDKIAVVKLDFSSKETIEATKVLATDEELGGLLQKFGAKTGFVTLVGSDGQIIDTIGKDDTESQIAAKLVTAIVNAS